MALTLFIVTEIKIRSVGVAILYKIVNNIPYLCLLMLHKCYMTKLKILLICIYRKQEILCNVFCEQFENFIEKIIEKGEVIVVVGDFNVWFDVTDHADTVQIKNINECIWTFSDCL